MDGSCAPCVRKFLKEIIFVFLYMDGSGKEAIAPMEALFDMTCKCAIVSS